MNDQEFKRLFQSMDHGKSTDLDVARWKRVVYRQLRDRTPSEWTRLAVACLLGFVIGAVTIKGVGTNSTMEQKIGDSDATIEHIYVNTQ